MLFEERSRRTIDYAHIVNQTLCFTLNPFKCPVVGSYSMIASSTRDALGPVFHHLNELINLFAGAFSHRFNGIVV